MTKANKPESRKSGTNPPKAAEVKTPTGQQTQANKDQAAVGKSRQTGKGDKPRVGGTAVPGAKSTQPREVNTTSPAQREAESYSREMRRQEARKSISPGFSKSLGRKNIYFLIAMVAIIVIVIAIALIINHPFW